MSVSLVRFIHIHACIFEHEIMAYRSIHLGLPGGQIGEPAPHEQEQDLLGVEAAAHVVLEGHAHVRGVAGAVDALVADAL